MTRFVSAQHPEVTGPLLLHLCSVMDHGLLGATGFVPQPQGTGPDAARPVTAQEIADSVRMAMELMVNNRVVRCCQPPVQCSAP